MLVNTGPVFVAILSGLFLHEGFPRRLVVGCIIGFGGAVVIGFATSTNGFQAGFGALLCIAAALVYAGGVTAEKPLLANNSALTVTWLACTIGAVVCLPFAPQLIHEIGKADLATIAWAVYLGVVPTAVGFSLWAYALARTTGGRMGAMAFLVPPVAIRWVADPRRGPSAAGLAWRRPLPCRRCGDARCAPASTARRTQADRSLRWAALEPMGRFELPANRLQGGCSTPELHRLGPDSPMGHPEAGRPGTDLPNSGHLR